jgi:serine/threonine-protein kinase RsbW
VEVELSLSLPREAASVPISRQVLDGCLDTLGVMPETRADIALALTEACANVVRHATDTDAYEVLASARNGRCIIEVLNTGPGAAPSGSGESQVPLTAEHGRGLKIMDAVVDDLRLTGNRRLGTTTVHFEKALRWAPGAVGQQLLGPARD